MTCCEPKGTCRAGSGAAAAPAAKITAKIHRSSRRRRAESGRLEKNAGSAALRV
jgi:hypothetical protein